MSTNTTPAASILSLLTGEGRGSKYPPAISIPGGGGKFSLDGDALDYPGNTFICHIDPESTFYQSLSDLQDAIRSLPQSGCMTFLPKSSFHMTLFCGVSGEPLGADGWPDGLAYDSTLEAITNHWLERLKLVDNLGGFTVRPSQMGLPYSVRMQASNDADATELLEARRCLENLTGLVRGDLESYKFHVTLAYLSRWLEDKAARELVDAANELYDVYLAGSDPVKLGPVEFCTFDTMHNFKPLLRLE